EQAVIEEYIQSNPAKKVTLPIMKKTKENRVLTQIDLKTIFSESGSWTLYYAFLYHTGLRAGDVAVLTHDNIDFKKKAIVSFIKKSRRIHEFPLPTVLLELIPKGKNSSDPLFPELYNESRKKVKDNLAKPRKYMQALLTANDLEWATLHSFRHTFNTSLRDLGLSIEDRQILLAHASSEVNKIYTHPNFDLASKYVNRIPAFKYNQIKRN
ncbi:MAG: tyrosine-type recombinase/integrase, partial [Candidatus Neomarinimicrobiota bacterium]|nr:tyrosine-type recombinase/integrase [Candidatus Neomarinimicrobiota bacterium]